MKIALIGTAYPYRGGLAAFNERLLLQFQNEGHEVTLYTFTVQYPNFLFPGKTQFSEEEDQGKIKIVRCVNSVNPLNWLKVGNQIKKENFDLVLVKYWLPFMGPCFGTILRRIKKNRKSKVVTIIDNMIPHESRPGDKQFTKYFVKPVDAFIAMSNTVLKDIDIFDKEKPRALSPHPLFDNFGKIEPREEALKRLGLSPDYKYLLFFGLIRKYKGLDILLEAMADERFKESNIKVIVAGEYYSDEQEYVDLIKKHQLQDRIIQVNEFIQDSDVAKYFNASDLVVQPYRSATQSGVTQIAYNFNKPMIVTDVGGLKEMCPDGKVGFVTPIDPKAISDAIFKFYEGDYQTSMESHILEEKKKYGWEILTKNIFTLAGKTDPNFDSK